MFAKKGHEEVGVGARPSTATAVGASINVAGLSQQMIDKEV